MFSEAHSGRRIPQVASTTLLRLKKHRYTERTKVYRADVATCNTCPLKKHCTDSQHGRSLKRSFDEESLEQVRASHATEPYQKAMRKRSVWVEPLFAEGKDWHETLSSPTTLACELRGADESDWPESEAVTQTKGLGTPPVAGRSGKCSMFLVFPPLAASGAASQNIRLDRLLLQGQQE